MNPIVRRKKFSLLYFQFQSLSQPFSTHFGPFDHFLVGKDIKKSGYPHDNTFYESCENSDDKIKFLESPAHHSFK